MRPGEPPTIEIASLIFNNLFFSSDRYDLSDVGRVKMNSRLHLSCSDKITILRNDDIIAIVKKMLDLRDGKDEVDDIDHLGNRRVRSVGELVENQARIGVYRMERAIKEKMTTLDVESAMPQDLINAKPLTCFFERFFRHFPIISIYGSNKSIVRNYTQKKSFSIRPWWFDKRKSWI